LLGISKLLMNEQVASVVNSYPGDNTDIIDRLYKGKIRFEVLPQVKND
jgi:acyl CoA:acetate/3-ketoacid CoA transferase alpha subunit